MLKDTAMESYGLGLVGAFKKFNSVPDSDDCFCSIIGYFNTEFFFEGHDQLDDVETVRTEIVDGPVARGPASSAVLSSVCEE